MSQSQISLWKWNFLKNYCHKSMRALIYAVFLYDAIGTRVKQSPSTNINPSSYRQVQCISHSAPYLQSGYHVALSIYFSFLQITHTVCVTGPVTLSVVLDLSNFSALASSVSPASSPIGLFILKFKQYVSNVQQYVLVWMPGVMYCWNPTLRVRICQVWCVVMKYNFFIK